MDFGCVQGGDWWGRKWGLGPVRIGYEVRTEGWPHPSHPAHTQGSQAGQDEVTASAYQAVILDQKYNNEPVQIRVPMGKEPPHLMSIFKGRMVVYQVWQ